MGLAQYHLVSSISWLQYPGCNILAYNILVAGSACYEGQRGRPGYEGRLHATHGGNIQIPTQFWSDIPSSISSKFWSKPPTISVPDCLILVCAV